MSSILVVGTYAIDYIGYFDESFADLPEPEALNLSIQLDGLQKGFGGCAMNIAVMLHKLGHHSVPFAYIGNQIDPDYDAHLRQIGVDQRGLVLAKGSELPAHALIATDADENQFTAFFPGAPKPNFQSDLERFLDDSDSKFEFVVIAPDTPAYMIAAAQTCIARNLPFISDPGQCTNAFSEEECNELVELSTMMSMNRYEFDVFSESVSDIESHLDLLIVTQGSLGVKFFDGDDWHHQIAAKPRRRVDPTGCGDAFRSGLVHAHLLGASWTDAIRAGCVLATINLEHNATQLSSVEAFPQRYLEEWQECPEWLQSEEQGVRS